MTRSYEMRNSPNKMPRLISINQCVISMKTLFVQASAKSEKEYPIPSAAGANIVLNLLQSTLASTERVSALVTQSATSAESFMLRRSLRGLRSEPSRRRRRAWHRPHPSTEPRNLGCFCGTFLTRRGGGHVSACLPDYPLFPVDVCKITSKLLILFWKNLEISGNTLASENYLIYLRFPGKCG